MFKTNHAFLRFSLRQLTTPHTHTHTHTLLHRYLRRYFELYQMFTEIDTSDDRRVDVDEFASAVERLGMWGVRVDDPVAEFNRIDRNKVRECPCVVRELYSV